MEYTDFCIAPERKNIYPLTADAIYHITADARYHISHPPIPDSMVCVITLRGHGEILLNTKKIALKSGDFLLFPASGFFEYCCPQVSWTFWWFEFRCMDPGFLTLPQERPLSLSLNDVMLCLCREALESLKLKDSKTASLLVASLLCLVQKENSQTARTDGALELFHKADQYIHRSLADATVESTARYLNISQRTLLNVFRRLLDISTTEYIQDLKMDMAGHLLTTTPASIQEISDRLGYADSFSFSKSFRRHFKVSPREYRKNSNPPTHP